MGRDMLNKAALTTASHNQTPKGCQGIVAYHLTAGYSDKYIIDLLMAKFGFDEKLAKVHLKRGKKKAEELMTKWQEKTAERNYERLEGIIEDAVVKNDTKTLLSAIDMENKLTGAYEKKVTLSSDSDAPFTIKMN